VFHRFGEAKLGLAGRQSGLVVSELDSRLKGSEFESCLIKYTKWKSGQSHAWIDSCTQFWLIVEKCRKPNGAHQKKLGLEAVIRTESKPNKLH